MHAAPARLRAAPMPSYAAALVFVPVLAACASSSSGAANANDTPRPSHDAGTTADAEIDAGPGAPRLLAEAERELQARTSSTYAHDTHVDEKTGVYDYDCSGFVSYALERSVPDGLATIQGASPKHPDAAQFEIFFASLAKQPAGRWRSVARALDLGPGDVVAWIEPTSIVTSNTGHIVIVRAASAHPTIQNAILLKVIDSTESPHGPTDSRAPGGSGLGTGTLVLRADADGTPTGYQWSDQGTSKVYVTPVAMGRML